MYSPRLLMHSINLNYTMHGGNGGIQQLLSSWYCPIKGRDVDNLLFIIKNAGEIFNYFSVCAIIDKFVVYTFR